MSPARQQLDPRDPIIAAIALRDDYDDDAILELAGELAEAIGAPLALVHAPIALGTERMRLDAAAELERLAARLRDGVPVTVHVKAGPSPVRALHETAEELGASLIVAGSWHRVGERLLHAAPCSVVLAPHGYVHPSGGLRRIGVAFRDGPEGAAALLIAAWIAGRVGALVTTYTVAGREPFDVDRSLTRVRRSVPAERLVDTVVLHGDPADELAAVSAGLDLLICGSRGYGPVRSLVVGGVSLELAHRARCPLLVVPRAMTE
jgi:nucleotide-binding universal stress UspA family protein